MAEQNCAHDDCDCIVRDGKGIDKEGRLSAADFAPISDLRVARTNANAAIRSALN